METSFVENDALGPRLVMLAQWTVANADCADKPVIILVKLRMDAHLHGQT